MPYTISVRIIDTTTKDPGFTLVEKTVWLYDGTWSNTDSIQTLVMSMSGTSGALRFRNGVGESFLVTLGVHNDKRWCDVVTDLTRWDTGVKIHPEYYKEGNSRFEALWNTLGEIQKTSAEGTKVAVKYVKEEKDGDGMSFVVHITIS
ncbi:lectin 1a [Suillus placidus]|uniref:Lectin 1a n=1 Tax=Suillus placidus TaxID=48579 RepID=A0A9P7D798_9AGAM|nr:lectin 1a [Suillus placidus]